MKELKLEAFGFDLCSSARCRSYVPPQAGISPRRSHEHQKAAQGDAGQGSTQTELFVNSEIANCSHHQQKLPAFKLLLLVFLMLSVDKKAGWKVQFSGHLIHTLLPCTAPDVHVGKHVRTMSTQPETSNRNGRTYKEWMFILWSFPQVNIVQRLWTASLSYN